LRGEEGGKMRPIKFKEQNVVFAENQEPYLPLPAYRHNDSWKCVTDCWALSFGERIRVLFTGRIYTTCPTFGGPLTPKKLSTKNPIIAEHINGAEKKEEK
jgi:hypothetical protein